MHIHPETIIVQVGHFAGHFKGNPQSNQCIQPDSTIHILEFVNSCAQPNTVPSRIR